MWTTVLRDEMLYGQLLRHLLVQERVSVFSERRQLMVAVISKTGIRLMPTSNYRARKLLARKKATVYRYRPFTIQLTERESGKVQPIEYAVDTGYYHVGNSIKTAKHELAAVEVRTLMDESSRQDDRRRYRRQRRSRLRYRAARFDNRKRPEGWLAPSIRHRMEQNLSLLDRVAKVVPITRIVMEMGQFDTQVLKAVSSGTPLPQGTDYQKGERYGIATLREAVFTRDHHTCQCCGNSLSDKVILHVHHIVYRSQGGTDSMANLATVCHKCHTPKDHKPGGKLYDWKPKLQSFKGATFMTAVRWAMYQQVKERYPQVEVRITCGAETKERRRLLDVGKSHVNDAYVMGDFHPLHRAHPWILQKKRRNNRILEKFYDAKYIDIRDGKKRSGQELFNGRTNQNHDRDTENLHRYRGEKVTKGRRSIRRQRYPFQPHDTVVYKGRKLETAGCHNKGSRLLLEGKSVSIRQVHLKRYSGGYYTVLS